MEEKYHSLLQVNVKHVKIIEIFRQLKKQAMFILALRRPNDFLRSNNPMQCSIKGKQTGLKTTLTQSRIVSITISLNYFHLFAK